MTHAPASTTPCIEIDDIALDPERIPRHVGIIMDGNSRWAALRKKSRNQGHRAGLNALKSVIEGNKAIGVEILSVYAFSTENWNRSTSEVDDLMFLFEYFFEKEFRRLLREGIRVIHSGDPTPFSPKIRRIIAQMTDESADNTQGTLNLAINYSGRQELVQAAKRLAQAVQHGELSPDEIDESALQTQLFQPRLPDLDLLIRTSGEYRISNYMLWQAAYAELVFTETLWPDFSPREFARAIQAFQGRERRFGGRQSAPHEAMS